MPEREDDLIGRARDLCNRGRKLQAKYRGRGDDLDEACDRILAASDWPAHVRLSRERGVAEEKIEAVISRMEKGLDEAERAPPLIDEVFGL